MDQSDPRTAAAAADGCPGFVTELVLSCGRGDEAALAALMTLTYAPVRALLGVAPRSASEADELVVRAFVHIWRQAASYDASKQEGVVAWLLDEAGSALGLTAPVLAAS